MEGVQVQSYMHFNRAHVTKEEVESGHVQLCVDLTSAEGGDDFAKLMYAMQVGWLFVERRDLPVGHWAEPYLRDIANETAKISGRVVASARYSGSWCSAVVKLVDGLEVTLKGQPVAMNEPFVLGCEWGRTVTIMVPLHVAKKGLSAGYVLRQLSTYVDGDENICDTDFDLDCSSFNDLVAIMAGESGTETMEKCLRQSGARDKSNLRNKAFLVRFDDEGNMTVTEA